MKVQKQFLASVLFVLMLFFFSCEVEPKGTESGGGEPNEWVAVTNLSQASGTWKAEFEEEYSSNPAVIARIEYTLDMYINLAVLTTVSTFVGDDVSIAMAWIGIKEMLQDDGVVFNDTDHSVTMTRGFSLDDFEIKRSGDKLKIRSRENESEIELSKTSDDWSSISSWTDIPGVWKGDISPEMVEMFEIVEMSDTPEMSETSEIPEIPEIPEMPEMPEMPVRYEIKLEVTVGVPTLTLTMTMDFGSELTDEVWAFIKELFLENDEYVINDDEHTVSMIMIIEEPLPIEDCEIHVDKKRLKLQNGEMAIILFKVEPGEYPPEEE